MIKKLAIFHRKLLKRTLCADRRPLRRDAIVSGDSYRPMGTRQNLALYYNFSKKTIDESSNWLSRRANSVTGKKRYLRL